LRWPSGVQCPACESPHVIRRGFDDTEPARQRYACHDLCTGTYRLLAQPVEQ
jgi:transposase-like protein